MPVYKYYVEVEVRIDLYSRMEPLMVYVKNKAYPIQAILEQRECFSEAGGSGKLFICRIGKQVRHLFQEKNRWFIESPLCPVH